MPLPIEVGIRALEVIRKKIPEQMFGSEGDDVFIEVTGKDFREFYGGVLNSYIHMMRLIEKEPNLEVFSELSISLARYGSVLNSTPEPDGSLSTQEAIEIFGEKPIRQRMETMHVDESARWKDYFLRVPFNVNTAHEAVAWTFGLTPDTYHPDFES